MAWLIVPTKTILVSGAVFILSFAIWTKKLKKSYGDKINKFHNILAQRMCYGRNQVRVSIIQSEEDWNHVGMPFVKTAWHYQLVGLDLEWVEDGKVALMQMALPDGSCILIRLNLLQFIPAQMKSMLGSSDIVKLGVGIKQDCDKLYKDYGIICNSWVDIRHLIQSKHPNIRSLGMGSIAKYVLNITIDKDRKIRRSNWEEGDAENGLSTRQKEYAANDALIALSAVISLVVEEKRNNWSVLKSFSITTYEDIIDIVKSSCMRVRGSDFNYKCNTGKAKAGQPTLCNKRKNSPDLELRGHKPRKSPLYHNAKLQAPDGQLLCVCDTKKAEWYVAKGIGKYVDDTNLIVRLNFEPSGRPRGPAGDYYLSTKNNCCVVCGEKETYVRKYVVPHEYRRYFPSLMRNHQSHDILLMCIPCHKLGGFYDLGLRRKLGEMCNAPVSDKEDSKMLIDMEAKKVKAAARALVNNKDGKIPENRVKELQDVILSYYSTYTVCDSELLESAVNIESFIVNDNYTPHGEKVVECFTSQHGIDKGIVMLEKLWRNHFLDSMRPQFLPPLWSVDHRQDWKFEESQQL